MQSTTQPSTPASTLPAELLTDHLLKIHRAQSDALAILHRVMIQAARLLEDPPLEKPYQTRTTNERMRIAMRSAATILNFRLPRLPSELSPPPAPSPSPSPSPSRSQREGRPRPCEVGEGSPSGFATAPAPTSSHSPAPVPALARDSSLIAHTSPLPPLSTHDSALKTLPPLPRNSSLVAHHFPSPPPDLTFEERATIYMTQQGVEAPPMPSIATKLRAWHLYTEATGIKPSFNITPESIPPSRPTRKRRSSPSPPSPAKPDRVDRAQPEEPKAPRSDLKLRSLNPKAPRSQVSVHCPPRISAVNVHLCDQSPLVPSRLTPKHPQGPPPQTSPRRLSGVVLWGRAEVGQWGVGGCNGTHPLPHRGIGGTFSTNSVIRAA